MAKYNLLSIIIVVGSAICTTLIFADYYGISAIIKFLTPDQLRFLAGLLSCVVFILSEITRRYNLPSEAGKHQIGLEKYTEVLRDADFILINILPNASNEQDILSKIELLKQKYVEVGSYLPKIPSGKGFLKLKQEHLKTIEISRKLDSNPFLNINKEFKNTTNLEKS